LDQELAKINVPSLVLWGTRDMVLNPRMFPRLVESLNQASPEVVPSAGHELHRSFPDLVSGRILEFLQQV
jgi:pimeloyl-ACP methyl ester carboxylesterase